MIYQQKMDKCKTVYAARYRVSSDEANVINIKIYIIYNIQV
jgi:hypothetical protein